MDKTDCIKYFKDIPPICREERQFALFLYNKLFNMIGKKELSTDDISLLKKCGIEDAMTVEQVTYEVTYMRDFFERERAERFKREHARASHTPNYHEYPDFLYNREKIECFNQKLFMFVYKDKDIDIYPNLNYGNINNYKRINIDKDLTYTESKRMSAMMKAKPDIGIIYSDTNGKYHLKFGECKYISKEGKDGEEPQTRIQSEIAEFLCKNIISWAGEDIVPDKSSIIQFCSELNVRRINEEKAINIMELQPYM